MRYGITFAYFQKDWNCDYLSVIPRAAKLGFQMLEVGSMQLLSMNQSQIANIAACAGEYGVELVHAFSLSRHTDISSEDPGIRKKGLDQVARILTLMYRMRCTNVGGINYVGWNSFGENIHRAQRYENSVSSMKEIMKQAEDLGIFYHVEVTNGYEQYLLNTASQAAEYCRDVDSPNIKILLDVNHMLTEETSFYHAIKTAGQYLNHFHAAQNNRAVPVAPGFLPWHEIAQGFREIGYDRGIVLEPLVISGGEIGADAKFWRNKIADASDSGLDTELMRALQFLRSVFR